MRCFFFFLLFITLSTAASAQLKVNIYWTEQTNYTAADVLYYSSRKPLQWKDFVGKPVESSPASAITASGFGYKADIKRLGNEGQLNVAVYCFFNKHNSWVKTGKNTSYILNHEQHHFDISFIAANHFMKQLKSASFTFTNYNAILTALYKESMQFMNKMQKDYDSETKNGQLREEQSKWDVYITSQLQALTK
jgi:hypothetical protein